MTLDRSTSYRRFNAPLPTQSTAAPSPPSLSADARALIPSEYRPPCRANERVLRWKPAVPSPRLTESLPTDLVTSDAEFERILDVYAGSWRESTKSVYGSGLLIYHLFCDREKVPEERRCPASAILLSKFITTCAGSYSGSCLDNYVAAIAAWHRLHGFPWLLPADQQAGILEGARRLAPEKSTRPKRAPFTVDDILRIHSVLDPTNSCDAAVYACLVVSFYCVARLGEFTVPSTDAFKANPRSYISRRDVAEVVDRNGLKATRFHIPKTKTSPVAGADTQCASQSDATDPITALNNHLRVNAAPTDAHLFAWHHPKRGIVALSKWQFLRRLSAAADTLQIPLAKGHGIRIGGTLEYLLRGVPFEAVKAMGRWAGDSFTVYLRKHAVILAPYLQDSPVLDPFTRYTLPPAA
ncbi:hypothetical protein CONPUDRAFT_64336 [Coniophora puteana RWD-64-598 SS2]|uniref:DNA breaking-rejoining enzyme n=1 Tax=Coniophora puteana (strain RWD-64-598) TaxID=741705 RepID=A0A5M3MBQ8_CONPW|nr:uncharacterized protein CONPUDRAFT_64336 [Coniophora puteana RWD-64-598 SS2]EIW76487.1 hypothetical protein CONPUDRAFT_64336 [Coniophora puteana RWD-64-598 SS2]